jgi:hypothetical protein
MVGLRHRAGRVAGVTKAVLAAVLLGGTLTAGLSLALAGQATAFSATPQWFLASTGAPASSLTCGTWYYTTMAASTGGGSATLTLTGGGGGGGGSSTGGLSDNQNMATGGAGAQTSATFTVPSGESVAAMIGCGGGGGGAHSSGTTSAGGSGGSGYAAGGTGGEQTTNGQQSGGGAGGGSSSVCVYSGTSTTPCGSLLAISSGGGGGGGSACAGNGGSGGNGNAGATTGTAANSEVNAAAPGGSANGQGFGGGGGGADSDQQANGGGGGGGVGAIGGTAKVSNGGPGTTGGGGAANSTGGAGGAKQGSGSGPVGTAGSGPNASGAGAVGPTNTSGTQHAGGGGGGAGYYGGGSGAANDCTILPALGAGGGGAGSSWVNTDSLTSFSNGSNPGFTAGSALKSTSCGQQEAQGTGGATNGAGGEGAPNSSTGAISAAYAGCPGNISLSWSALPGAPTGVTATGASGQITASWTAPADSGTSPITGYKVSAAPVGGGSTVTQTFNSTATTESVSGLTNGVQYNVSVAAITTVGTGPSASASNNPISLGTAPSITSGNSTTFTVGTAGTFTVTTTGSPTPALSENGALPSGVTFLDNGVGTAALAGTPATGTGGTYTFNIGASNSIAPNASQTFTLTVDEAPSITSGNSATFSEGNAGSSTITTSGFPTAALSETGALPNGVTFTDNGDGTATLAGTPAASSRGSYPITINATNGVSPDASQSFTLTVNAAPAITSASTTTFTEGVAGTFTVMSNAAPNAALSESGALPSGVTFVDNGDGTATLAGTPDSGTQGTYPISITASNGVSPDATQDFALVVDGPPTITSGNAATFTVGSAGTFTVTSTGTPTAALSESGTLPTGVTFTDNGDGTAALAGTPAAGQGGSYPISITASNGVTPAANQSFTLTVDEAASITSGNSASFTAGSANSFTVTTGGFPTAGLSETGALPSGVTFIDNGDGTATLAGNPAAGSGGSYPLTITAANGIGSANQSFTLNVSEAPTITSADATTFVEGTAATFTITTTGTPVAAISETGNLPDGITFTDNGDGTATLRATTDCCSAGAGYTNLLTITASNGVVPDAVQSFTLTLEVPAGFSSPDSASFARYAQSSFTVVTTGNPAPTLTEVGNLPKGLTYSNGVISGAAKKAGSTQIAFLANNGIGDQAVQYFTLTVTPFQITTTSLPDATAGQAYSVQLTASGGVTPYRWKAKGTLPTGLTLTKAGVLSGTVASPGSDQISVKVTDSKTPTKETLSTTLTLTVDG